MIASAMLPNTLDEFGNEVPPLAHIPDSWMDRLLVYVDRIVRLPH
jgi:hypothetical protein